MKSRALPVVVALGVLVASCDHYEPPTIEEGLKTGEVRQESICGGVTDWQDVERYDGTLGPTTVFVSARQAAVGHMNPKGCSGTMISRDLFLTAGHCVDANTVTNQKIQFNFQNDPSGVLRTSTDYAILEVIEKVDEPKVGSVDGMDYAILRLASSPGDIWGITVPAMFSLPAGQAIALIQHPNLLPKKVEGGTLGYDTEDGEMTYGDLDTEGGTSGSGILLNATGNLVGVHTRGTADDSCSSTDPNGGWPINLIWARSTALKPLVLDAAKVNATASVEALVP